MSPEQATGQAGRQARRHLGVRRRALRDADGQRARSKATTSPTRSRRSCARTSTGRAPAVDAAADPAPARALPRTRDRSGDCATSAKRESCLRGPSPGRAAAARGIAAPVLPRASRWPSRRVRCRRAVSAGVRRGSRATARARKRPRSRGSSSRTDDGDSARGRPQSATSRSRRRDTDRLQGRARRDSTRCSSGARNELEPVALTTPGLGPRRTVPSPDGSGLVSSSRPPATAAQEGGGHRRAADRVCRHSGQSRRLAGAATARSSSPPRAGHRACADCAVGRRAGGPDDAGRDRGESDHLWPQILPGGRPSSSRSPPSRAAWTRRRSRCSTWRRGPGRPCCAVATSAPVRVERTPRLRRGRCTVGRDLRADGARDARPSGDGRRARPDAADRHGGVRRRPGRHAALRDGPAAAVAPHARLGRSAWPRGSDCRRRPASVHRGAIVTGWIPGRPGDRGRRTTTSGCGTWRARR